jgi:DHA1 family inner membrane transport protein
MGTVLTTSQPESRRAERIVLLVLFLALFVGTADNQIMGPLLPVLAKSFGKTAGEFGRVVTVYSLCAAVAALMTGLAADLRGQAWFLKGAMALFAASAISTSFAPSAPVFTILRGLTGISAGVISSCTISYAADYFPYKERGRAMGIIMSSYFAACTLGVVGLGILADRAGWPAGYQAIAATAFITFALFVTLMPRHYPAADPQEDCTEGSVALVRPATIAMFLLAFMVSGGLTTFLVYIGAYLSQTFHRTTSEIALVFVIGGVPAVIGAPIAGKIADKIGKRPLIILGNLVMAVTFGLIPRLRWGFLLFALFGIASLAAGLRHGPFQAFSTAVIGRHRRALLVAVRNVCSQLGIASGALLGGTLYNKPGGFTLVALFCAGLTLAACVPVMIVKEPNQDG